MLKQDVLYATSIAIIVGAVAFLVVSLFQPGPKRTFVISGALHSCHADRQACGYHVYSCDDVQAEVWCAHNLVEVTK